MQSSEIHLEAATEAELAAWHELAAACWPVDHPERPPLTPMRSRDMLVPEGPEQVRGWLARDAAGRPTGLATMVLWARENAHLVSINVRVRPQLRRTGIGRHLAGLATDAARAAGRTTAVIGAGVGSPGGHFARSLGYAHAFSEVSNLLRMSEVDPVAVAGWAAGAEAKTDGLVLVPWLSHVPAEVFEAFLRARASLDDVPMEDLDVRPEEPDGELFRQFEDGRLARGIRWHGMGAYEPETGVMAGCTTIHVDPEYPWANVGSTVVQPAYRGRGIGLWVKAALIERLAGLEPHLTGHVTGNAAVNSHMRRINERLGYRVLEEHHAWQRQL